MSYLDQFFFGLYPYLVASVFGVATLARFRRDPYGWQASSSQLLRKGGFTLASNLFHVGVLALAGGHFAGLVVPAELNRMAGMSDGAHQMLEIVMGSIFGTATLVGLSWLIYRRFTDPRVRAHSSPSDRGIVILLWIALVAGMATLPFSWATRHEGPYLHALNGWAQALLTFRPIDAVAHIAPVPFAFKLHVVLGLGVFLVFPFTRLVHVCSAPLGYLLRSHYQVVRRSSA